MTNKIYHKLELAVQKARAKTAKFYRVDLHVHTVDSHDFPSVQPDKPGFVGTIPDDEKNLRADLDEFKRRFVRRAKEQDLSLIAVTDHNESGMAEQLSEMSDDEIIILPGMEIHVQTNLFTNSIVHILGVFPQGTSSKKIDQIFADDPDVPESGNRKGASTALSIEKIIKRIVDDMHGVCIAAHVGHEKNDVRTMVLHQNVEWLQKNYLRMYLVERDKSSELSEGESERLQKLRKDLKPLDDETQNEYLRFLCDHNFNAVQITQPEHKDFYTDIHMEPLGLSPFSCVLASDAHTLADLGCPGYGTHIKMTAIGVDGLRKAFLDPGTRIRYDTTVPESHPKRILGMTFEGGSFDGEVIGFSDNLTALIGGRGAGKSALIEALRFVFQQSTDELPERLRKDIENRRDFTLRETEIKVLFVDGQGKKFVLKRRLEERSTSCFTLDGKLLPEIKLPNSQSLRVDIYGWSEIEELSDSSRKQLRLLDKTVSGIDNLKRQVQAKVEQLRQNGERIVALAREIQGILPHIEGAEEVRRQLNDLKTPELDKAFANFDQNRKALDELEALEEIIKNAETWLLTKGKERKSSQILSDAPQQANETPTPPLWIFTFSQDLSESLQEAQKNLEGYTWYEQFVQVIEENAEQLQTLYGQLLGTIKATWNETSTHIEDLQKEREDIVTGLNVLAEKSGQPDFKATFSRRQELSQEESRISDFEGNIQEMQTEINRLFKIRNQEITPALYQARKEVYQARKTKADEIAARLASSGTASGISIEIEHLGDVVSFSQKLGYRDKRKRYSGLFQKIDQQYWSKDYPGFYTKKFRPHKFVDILLGDIDDCASLAINFIRKRSDKNREIVHLVKGKVKEENGELVEYADDGSVRHKRPIDNFELVEMKDTEKVWKHLSPRYYEGEVSEYYDPEKLEALLDLEISDIEDRPKILLDGKPIEGLSPGQRCSALIPIILVEGENPIVIDQPEDNLDNKRVFDLVVDIVRGLKERRQIIVATHNPNIPVSGDAEQVVVLKSSIREVCGIAEQGSIDDEEIIRQVKAIMEGGEDAFIIRMKKYGLYQV